MKLILSHIDLEDYFHKKQTFSLVKDRLFMMCSTEWENSITNFPKLRTYKTFKSEYKCETYVELNLTRAERSILAQFRCGMLPLRIETWRIVGEPEADCIYKMCKSSYVENERHFLLD